ncbi:MAG: AMP-binding protein, partial [Acidimicrobiales bacterium]|nr:AMP-binding protein [Acidimicrobiales bacterium]
MRWRARIDLATGRGVALGTLLERVAEVHPHRPLVHELSAGRTLTTTEAAALVDRLAAAVAAQTELGDRVVVAMPNGYDQLFVTLAASRAGRLPAPVNSQMTEAEVEHVVADSGASLVVRSIDDLAAEPDALRPFGRAVQADPRSVAALFYTSGTT